MWAILSGNVLSYCFIVISLLVKVMAVFYLISVLSILIVFIVPYIIGTRYMIKKQIAWHIQILWLLLIVLTSYGGLVVCMLYNKDI